jgi:ribonuclease P/MRP protein subunit POP5
MEEGEGRGDNKKMKIGKSKIQNQFVFCILYFALLIPPSLRDRRRYLVFELMSEREIDKWALLKEIRDSVFSLYGDVGVSESKIRLMEYTREDTDRGMGILRCAHDKVEEVRAALACIHSANEARLSIRVIGTSGTIKGATHLL